MIKFEPIEDPYPGMIGWFSLIHYDWDVVILVQVIDICSRSGITFLEVVPIASHTPFLIDPRDLMARRTVDTKTIDRYPDPSRYPEAKLVNKGRTEGEKGKGGQK